MIAHHSTQGQGGLMCGIWDWQSTKVKDLNDSQDPKHTLICRENAFVAIYALFSDNKYPLFTCLGRGRPKRTLSTFFTVFLIGRLPLLDMCYKVFCLCSASDSQHIVADGHAI